MLVLPIRHVPTILDLGDSDAADLILEVRRALPDRGGTDWGPVPRLPLPATDAIAHRLRTAAR